MACCPFHEENNPSFGMLYKNQMKDASFNCFGCGVSGTFKQLMFRLAGNDTERYRSSLKLFGADIFLEEIKFEKPIYTKKELNKVDFAKAVKEYGFQEIDKFSEGFDYLKNRGVNEDAVIKLKLMSHNYCLKRRIWERRIVFPIMDKDHCYGFTGRSWDDNKVYVKDYCGIDKKYLLLGEHLYEPNKPLLLTEGLIGLACLISKGVDQKYNVMATMGAAFMEDKMPRILKQNSSVFFLFDNDEAGITNTALWAEALSKQTPVFTYDWSKTDKKDVDQLGLEDLTLEKFKVYIPNS